MPWQYQQRRSDVLVISVSICCTYMPRTLNGCRYYYSPYREHVIGWQRFSLFRLKLLKSTPWAHLRKDSQLLGIVAHHIDLINWVD